MLSKIALLITLLCITSLILATPLTPTATIDISSAEPYVKQIAPLSPATGLPENFTRQTAPVSSIAMVARMAESSSVKQSAPLTPLRLPENFTRQTAPLRSIDIVLVDETEPFSRQTAPVSPVAPATVPKAEPSIRQSVPLS